MNVEGLANFLDSLTDGVQLLCLAVVVGSLSWASVVLRAWHEPGGVARPVLLRCVGLLRAGALALALAQLVKLSTQSALLASSLGEVPWAAYTDTSQFQVGIARALLSLMMYVAARRLAEQPTQRRMWAVLIGLAAATLVSSAWLVHAVGRLEDRGLLMTLTVIHQAAAAAWVGGVIQLLALHRLGRTDEHAQAFWPLAVTRFSGLGVAAVGALLVTGGFLAVSYIGSFKGLFGTGYGSLVVAKMLLLALVLGFAFFNFRAGRRWLRNLHERAVVTRVPYYIEAESFLLVSLLFLAASVSTQPPATDIPELTASATEVGRMFAPKVPSLTSPSHAAMLAGQPGSVAIVNRLPSVTGAEWSNYNHNIAGLFLVAMSVAAALGYVRGFAWARYWPLGFVALGVFLFFRADAETWPLGPVPFWDGTLKDSEVLQHRIGTLLAFGLGVLETRTRTVERSSPRLRFVFPLLCAFGGISLITHSHMAFEIKSRYLIESTHLVMGLFAVMMAAGRWLELRLAADDTAGARFAGLAAVTAMLMIGLTLTFYREPVI